MKNEEFKVIIDSFLAGDNLEELLSKKVESEDDRTFARALTAMAAERKLEDMNLKERFKKLDRRYQTSVLDQFTQNQPNSPRNKMIAIMKAALDDISERKIDFMKQNGLNILSDEMIRDFLSGSDE